MRALVYSIRIAYTIGWRLSCYFGPDERVYIDSRVTMKMFSKAWFESNVGLGLN